MREAEFRKWLAASGQVRSSISTRISDLRRIEREFGDLDDQNSAELDAVAAKLTLTPDGRNQSPFTIEGNIADGLSTLRSALGIYRRFQHATPAIERTQADQIRDFVIHEFVEPARRSLASQFQVTSGDVHARMGLENAMPNVCSALESRKFAERAGVFLASREGPHRSSTVRYTFRFNGAGKWAEAELRRRYGAPIADTDKMVGFALPDGRQLALQRDVAGNQLWVEDRENFGRPPVEQARHYLADQPRHSNLPWRLKHSRSSDCQPRRVAMLVVKTPEMLRAVLDWYEGEQPINVAALEALRRGFEAAFPDFRNFADTTSGFHRQEDDYKRALIRKVQDAVATQSGRIDDIGSSVLDLVLDRSTNLIGNWRTYDHLIAVRGSNQEVFDRATGALANSADAPGSAAATFLQLIWPLISAGQDSNMPFGDSRILPTLILALARPGEAIALRYQPFNNLSLMLLGRPAFANAPLSIEEHANMIALARAIERVMRDEWGWKPRDLWDVQGFIWVTCQKRLAVDEIDSSALEPTGEIGMQPTNLILYGPPGTGKTYATAEEALRLCGEEVPHDRHELMAKYHRLTDAGRIEFVTFHQSYAYEEFVEGLRPVQQEDESAGFHLHPEPGVLRRVARRAETSTGSGGQAFAVGDRKIFKMSIGRANDPDDAYLFEEALDGGYALIGFDDLDWSDPRFTSRDEIIARLRAEGNRDGEISPYAGRVQSPDIFRNWVRAGDLIIVSKGNSLFRAIGEVVGDYEYEPGSDGRYPHRRRVNWLWIDRAGAPVDEIYSTHFIQKTIYELTRRELNIPALERYVESQREGRGGPDQFVLIIDEINRANVSKVMGELITLLEPDKRIGGTNELRVRLPYSRDLFGLPSNLHIIGTMNTADRSIALLDTALRRRFKFREVAPEPQLLAEAEEATGLPLVAFLSTINDRIEYLLDREHRIGHAYFINCRTREDADAAMRNSIIPLLQEYFFEDLGRVAAVLGEPKGGGFLDCRRIKDPLGEGDARDSWSILYEFSEDAYNRCLTPAAALHLVESVEQAAE